MSDAVLPAVVRGSVVLEAVADPFINLGKSEAPI